MRYDLRFANGTAGAVFADSTAQALELAELEAARRRTRLEALRTPASAGWVDADTVCVYCGELADDADEHDACRSASERAAL